MSDREKALGLLAPAVENASKSVDRQSALIAAAGQVQALAGIGHAILELASAIRAAGEGDT